MLFVIEGSPLVSVTQKSIQNRARTYRLGAIIILSFSVIFKIFKFKHSTYRFLKTFVAQSSKVLEMSTKTFVAQSIRYNNNNLSTEHNDNIQKFKFFYKVAFNMI
jgi:hypothetical protein